MGTFLTLEQKAGRLTEVGAPLVLVSGPGPMRAPHLFQCVYCLGTFSRHFTKVFERKQFCCQTPECKNYVRTVGVKPISTEAKVRAVLAEYGAEIISEYKGLKHPVDFRCECGVVKSMTPTSVVDKSRFGTAKQLPRCSECAYKLSYLHGDKHPLFNPDKPEITEVCRSLARKDGFYREVKELFDFTCVITLKRGGRLAAHHLNNLAHNLSQAKDVNNGVSLSRELHREFHNTYGYGNNTVEQFAEFYAAKTGRQFQDIYDLPLASWKLPELSLLLS